jgi:hypothetical protein
MDASTRNRLRDELRGSDPDAYCEVKVSDFRALLSADEEVSQLRRVGLDTFAEALGKTPADLENETVGDIIKAHPDPRAAILSLENAKATEVKFRQVKAVSRELRNVIGELILTMRTRLDGIKDNQVKANAMDALDAAVKFTALPSRYGDQIGEVYGQHVMIPAFEGLAKSESLGALLTFLQDQKADGLEGDVSKWIDDVRRAIVAAKFIKIMLGNERGE